MAKRVRPGVRVYRTVQAAVGGGSAAVGEGVEDSKVKWWNLQTVRQNSRLTQRPSWDKLVERFYLT